MLSLRDCCRLLAGLWLAVCLLTTALAAEGTDLSLPEYDAEAGGMEEPPRPLLASEPTSGDLFDESIFSMDASPSDQFTWQVAPASQIWHSYQAGPVEPRTGITMFAGDGHGYWDATVGVRSGMLRYGDRNHFLPQGWQMDLYGAAIVRMDAEIHQDLNGSDFVFGFPLTYGVDNWQFKVGYAHLSSHLGDEYARRNPGTLEDRINYVRDGLQFGSSWFPEQTWLLPPNACRLYSELDWAFHTSGGAKPLTFQFGTEISQSGVTGRRPVPFLAVNGRMRQEVDYGGDLTTQAGWLWRGETAKIIRLGAHYYNGKSSQSQFFRTSEQQIGVGLWYDF